MSKLHGGTTHTAGIRDITFAFAEPQDQETIVKLINDVSPVKPTFGENGSGPVRREGKYDEQTHGYYITVKPESLFISVNVAHSPLDLAYLSHVDLALRQSGIKYTKDFRF